MSSLRPTIFSTSAQKPATPAEKSSLQAPRRKLRNIKKAEPPRFSAKCWRQEQKRIGGSAGRDGGRTNVSALSAVRRAGVERRIKLDSLVCGLCRTPIRRSAGAPNRFYRCFRWGNRAHEAIWTLEHADVFTKRCPDIGICWN